MLVPPGLALPRDEGPGGQLVVVEQADDDHHHHRHHHDDDDNLNKLQFSCKTQTKGKVSINTLSVKTIRFYLFLDCTVLFRDVLIPPFIEGARVLIIEYSHILRCFNRSHRNVVPMLK